MNDELKKALEVLAAAEKAATAGPWPESYIQGGIRHLVRNCDPESFWCRQPTDPESFFGLDKYKDGPFIALSRNSYSALLAAFVAASELVDAIDCPDHEAEPVDPSDAAMMRAQDERALAAQRVVLARQATDAAQQRLIEAVRKRNDMSSLPDKKPTNSNQTLTVEKSLAWAEKIRNDWLSSDAPPSERDLINAIAAAIMEAWDIGYGECAANEGN